MTGKKCAIYARVSTDKQAEHNISIPDQIARARVYAELQGWEVVEVFVDPGASGRDDRKRPKFRQMIAEALMPHHPFDFILVHSFSRFYRDHAQSELVRRDLKKKRVQVKSLTQEVNDDGAGGTLALSVMGLIDEYQSRENSKHVRRAIEANARDGFRSGGTTPYGYRLFVAEMRGQRPKHKLEIDPAESAVVANVFERHQRGLGISKITEQLNAEGFRTRKGGKWMKGAIGAMLTCETYVGRNYFKGRDEVTGEVKPRSEWIEIPCPAIVTETVFQAVQEQLAERAPNVTAPRVTTSPVLLGGIAHCAACGRPLQLTTGTSRTGAIYRYYKCSSKVLTGACPGGAAVSIPESALDSFVMESLAEQLMTPERIMEIAGEVHEMRSKERESSTDRVRQLKHQYAQLKRQEKNLWDLAASVASRPRAASKSGLPIWNSTRRI